jgi:hypothetical protein
MGTLPTLARYLTAMPAKVVFPVPPLPAIPMIKDMFFSAAI